LGPDSEDEPQRRKEESSSKFNKRYDLWVTRHPDKVGRRSKREYNEVAEMHYSENEEDDEDFDGANDDDVGVRAEDLDEDDADIVAVIANTGDASSRAKKRKKKKGRPPKQDRLTPVKPDKINKRDFTSPAWMFFDLEAALGGSTQKVKLKCRMCSSLITWDKKSRSTKELNGHAKRHKKMYEAIEKIDFAGNDADLSFENFQKILEKVEGQPRLSLKPFKGTEIVMSFICWVISADVPLHKFNDRYWLQFKTMFSAATGNKLVLPGINKISEYIEMVAYCAEASAIASIQKAGSVALAIDMWTSLAKDHFMGVTYHWIDENFDIHARVMDLYPFFGSATGDMIAKVVDERFTSQFGDTVYISAIVSDRGANVKLARDTLVPLDSEDCVPHKLDTAVHCVIHPAKKGGSFWNAEASVDLAALHSWMVWLRGSSARESQLQSAMPDGMAYLGPILGALTRWWGKHKMLKRVFYLREALQATLELNGRQATQELVGGSNDFGSQAFWSRCEAYRDIFAILNKLSVISQREKIESKSTVIHYIAEVQKGLKIGEADALPGQKPLWNSFVRSIAFHLEPFYKTVNNSTIAHVLNPSNYNVVEGVGRIAILSDDVYKRSWGQLSIDAINCEHEKHKEMYKGKDVTDPRVCLLLKNIKDGVARSVENGVLAAEIEVMAKAKEMAETGEKFDLLRFWKDFASVNSTVAPIMDALKAVLAIPASAAGPERLFSFTRKAVSNDRTSLKPETVSSMAIGRSWLRDPPKDFQSWTGKKRQRFKNANVAIISADKMLKIMKESHRELNSSKSQVTKKRKLRQLSIQRENEIQQEPVFDLASIVNPLRGNDNDV
jgi:hypothetical protein